METVKHFFHRKPYPSEVSDGGMGACRASLVLLPEDACLRRYPLHEVCHTLRSLVTTGANWRLLPHDGVP